MRLCADQDSDIWFHLPYFKALVEELDATHVIELGVRSGISTIAFLHALEGRGTLTSVDVSPHPGWSWPHWEFIQGSDLDVVGQMRPADIVFIDTSHLYDHTHAELAAYLPLVKRGGRILCHDTQLEHPAGEPLNRPYPVRSAVSEFCAQHHLVWSEVKDCWGLATIHVC